MHGQDKLIYMANQIATFFESQPRDEAPKGIANHINKFWEPRMRKVLFERLDAGGDGLNPLVIEATPLFRRPYANPDSGEGTGRDAAEGAHGSKGPEDGATPSRITMPD